MFTVRRRPAGWRRRKHPHRQSQPVCWLDSPTGAPYRGEPRWVDRVGLEGGTHIVEALHCDVVQAPDQASDRQEFPAEVDGGDPWLRSIGLPVGVDNQLGYVGWTSGQPSALPP